MGGMGGMGGGMPGGMGGGMPGGGGGGGRGQRGRRAQQQQVSAVAMHTNLNLGSMSSCVHWSCLCGKSSVSRKCYNG